MVCEPRPIVFLHEVHDGRMDPVRALPETPEPLGAEAGHGIHAKVDEDAHLGLVIPLQHFLHSQLPNKIQGAIQVLS